MPRPHHLLARWLAAEAADDAARADEALRGLFRRLPRPAPRAGFALRVLAAAGIAAAPPARAPRLVRWGVAALLASAGAGVVGLSLALHRLLVESGLAGVLEDLALGVSAASRWLATALAVWQKAAGWLAELLATPEAAVAAAGGVIVAAFALHLLSQLLTRERSLSYATP